MLLLHVQLFGMTCKKELFPANYISYSLLVPFLFAITTFILLFTILWTVNNIIVPYIFKKFWDTDFLLTDYLISPVSDLHFDGRPTVDLSIVPALISAISTVKQL